MKTFDYLIVGAGTAGSVLAARLSEAADLRVGLLEAGGRPADPDIADPLAWPALQGRAFDWCYSTLPQAGTAGRVHAWPRGRVVGGSSVLNAMAHVRGHPSDFDGWNCPGWGFADLLPYFIRSEHSDRGASQWHGVGGPLHLITPDQPHPVTQAYRAAAEEIGLAPTDEHNGPRMAGPTLNTLTIKDGRRQSTADAYLSPEVLARLNLTLFIESAVAELLFEGTRCCGLLLAGGERLRAERGVILAAGAVASPLLLLRAGIGPAAELAALGIAVRSDLPGVGRNLQDHLLSGGNVYRAKRPLPPSKYQGSESLLYIHRQDDGAAPELVLACVVAPVVTDCLAPPEGPAYTLMYGFTRPRSRGTIRLASADPRTAPLIDPNYLAEDYDRAVYLEALDRARALGAAAALDDWRDGEHLPGTACRDEAERLRFLGQAAYTHHHPAGTCRMGADVGAVVDFGLQVQGHSGLYVIDASVFPAITTGPINAAIVALAERASDLLRGRSPLSPRGVVSA